MFYKCQVIFLHQLDIFTVDNKMTQYNKLLFHLENWILLQNYYNTSVSNKRTPAVRSRHNNVPNKHTITKSKGTYN